MRLGRTTIYILVYRKTNSAYVLVHALAWCSMSTLATGANDHNR